MLIDFDLFIMLSKITDEVGTSKRPKNKSKNEVNHAIRIMIFCSTPHNPYYQPLRPNLMIALQR